MTDTEDASVAEAARRPDAPMPRADELIRRVIQIVEQARPMPLSASSMINKEELLPLLQQALAGLPEELRAARWLLKEREDFLARMQLEGQEILAAARTRAEQMVQRTEVNKMAEQRAQKLVNDASDRARQLKLETEDWCDQRLGGIEGLLQKTLNAVAEGRARMQGATRIQPPLEPPPEDDPDRVFDQDAG